MSPIEQAAFIAGIHHAADMALIAAVTMEVRPDARDIRQRAAIEALRGLADGLKGRDGNPHSGNGSVASHLTQLVAGRDQALAAGYTGDACANCGNFTLRRSGTCLCCDSCGSTTGCS